MRGLGYVPINLLREALQAQGRGGPIVNPFSAADYAYLTWNDPANPPPAWQRIRGANVYGPGAVGNYSWMNGPDWQVSPEGTELLNLNRDIIRHVVRFEDINWNDPRMRFPESFMPSAAASPVPEVAAPAPAPATPAPPASQPVFNTAPAPAPAPAVPVYSPSYSSDPMDMPSETPKVQQAGFLSNLPSWALPLIAVGLAMPIILGPRRRRR